MAGESNPVELNKYEVVFYNSFSRMELERISDIPALNPVEAERTAWRMFDAKHNLEANVSRSYYHVSVRGPGQ